MTDWDKVPKDKRAENKKELLKEFAIEELIEATYYSSEENFDANRIAALVKIIDEPDAIPDEFKAEAFFERFGKLHNIDMHGAIKVSDKSDTESSSYKAKNLDKIIKRQITKKNLRRIRIATAMIILLVSLGTVNIVTYASAKKNVFEVIKETVGYIFLRIDAKDSYREIIDDKYLMEIEEIDNQQCSLEDLPEYFIKSIYLPSKNNEMLKNVSVTYNVSDNDNIEAIIEYELNDNGCLLVFVSECYNSEDGIATIFIPGDRVKTEYYFQKGDEYVTLNLYLNEESNYAYMCLGAVMYSFQFNFELSKFLDIFESMEVYK